MTDLAAIECQDSDSDVHAYIAQMFPNGAIKTVLLLSPPDAGRDLFNYQTVVNYQKELQDHYPKLILKLKIGLQKIDGSDKIEP